MILFTIGHSNHTTEKLIQLLQAHNITLLVDVRSAPYSRYVSQFNKENLQAALHRSGIRYAYAGKALGGRPPDPSCYKSRSIAAEGSDYLHEVDYPEVMKRAWFVEGIQHLLELAEKETSAILCTEEDPAACHRHHLISLYLLQNHPEVEVRHLRGDGTEYSAASVTARVDKDEPKQLPLF